MGVTLVNIPGFQRGVENNESGINIESIEVRYFPQFKEFLKDEDGLIIGFAVPSELSREITLQGEISGSNGLMAATHTSAVSLANDTGDFDAGGSIYMEEASVSQARAAWRSLSMRLSSHPSSVSIAYVGTNSFTLQKREPRGSANDVPTELYTYRGRASLLDSFLNSHGLGTDEEAGYIVDYSTRAGGPYTEVDLIVALAPDFQTEVVANGMGIKTGRRSKEIDTTGGLAGVATKTVSYYSPETRYTYFASSKPNGPRFSKVAISTQPRLIKSVIEHVVTVPGTNPPDTETQKTLVYSGATAPANLVAGLAMPVQDKVISHESEPILGTKWYRCVDVVARELKGDDA